MASCMSPSFETPSTTLFPASGSYSYSAAILSLRTTPPYQVQWTTPSGEVHSSTSFSNGNFYLSVPMPIESGSYTCRIPPHLSARACLHGNDTSEGWASVTVDSVAARLLLLEKENWDLKHKLAQANGDLASRLTSQNQTMADLASRMTQEDRRLDSQLQQTQSQLSATATNLQTRLGKLEDAQQNQVAFHATGLSASTVAVGANLVFSHVVYNLGNAYSPSTGHFTVPYSGLYFFIAKTSMHNDNTHETHYLTVDSFAIDRAYTSHPQMNGRPAQSPIHGVVHLTQGQRVYVTCDSNVQLWDVVSAFTGFLLSRDP